MSRLVSDFPLLPDINDPDCLATYAAVYDQLQAMGLPTPGPASTQITRAQLLQHLQTQAGKIVKEEVKKTANPDYTGKTDAETAGLLDSWRNPEDYHNPPPPPINAILIGLPFAPNAVNAEDVTEAKKNNALAGAQAHG